MPAITAKSSVLSLVLTKEKSTTQG
ncbi:uncharacterized protein METZ01_LOCUS70650 [marine metagenome]|uniref:Uncharacterized protein n=1 Tax=marine metagenome TaxID=408172 RepID=A0A381TNZ7_9ZZZZ